MRNTSVLLRLAAAVGGILLCVTAAVAADATAMLKNAKGEDVGQVQLTQTPNGVLIHAEVHGLPAGTHAFHIHETGVCTAPAFTSAGGHFNPTHKHHGFKDPNGPHLGDLPNLFIGSNGSGQVDVFGYGVHLTGENAVLDANGAAFVIHAGADDYASDPSGDAGARLACGVIQR